MTSYEVRINLTFQELNKQLEAINRQANNIGKSASLGQIVAQSREIRNNLEGIAAKLSGAIRAASAGMATQLGKANILQNLGAPLSTVNARANLAQPFVNTLNTAKQLNTAIAQIISNLQKARAQAIQFQAVMMAASAATGKALSMPTFPKIAAGFAAVGSAARSFGSTAQTYGSKVLNAFTVGAQHAASATENWGKQVRGNMSLMGMWWQHFGRIAIGFTIAYRAMNAFEALLRKTGETIRMAIQESGELATLQGKIAMFTVMASRGTITFDKAYRQSGEVIKSLAQASIRSISSIQELGVAMDELAQAGVQVKPALMKEFVSFVDFTSLISQTTGDNIRQIRSEVNALMEGQTRANNTLIRTMKNFGILDDKMISSLRKMQNRGEAFEKIIKAIHEVWSKFVDKAISSDPTLALSVWDKSIRRLMISTIMLVSNTRGQFNLFAATIKEHIDRWNKAFSGDLTKNLDVKRFAIMMLQINKALNFALTAFEGIIKGVASLATAFDNLDASVKRIVKIVLVWEALMLVWKGTKLLWSALKALNAGFIVAITYLGPWTTMLLAVAAATFVAANAFSVWTGKLWDTTAAGTVFSSVLEELIRLWNALPEGLLSWMATGAIIGGATLGPWGAAGGAGIGLVVGSVVENLYKKTHDANIEYKNALDKEQYELEKSIAANSKRIIELSVFGASAEAEELLAENEANVARLKEVSLQIDEVLNYDKKSPFLEATFKRTMESLSALASEIGPRLSPLVEGIKAKIRELIYPHIDLTQKKGEEDPWAAINRKAEVNIEDLKKKLGSLDYNIYEQFIRAVNAGKVALADLFAAPAADELTAKIRELRDKLVDVKTGLAWSRRGTTDWYVFRAALTGINAEIVELGKNLDNIKHMQQLAPAVDIANKLKDEYDSIISTLEDGSTAQIKALIALREKYVGTMVGIDIIPDDKKQVDALNTYTTIMEKLRDVTLDWKVGVRAGLREVAKPQIFEMFRDVVVSSFKSMEDAIVDFTKTGKQAFRVMAESILNDLLRIIVRMSIIQPLANLFTSTFFASAATTPKPTVAPFVPHASGGWLNEKIVGLGLSSGKIHTFGEKGPEYITPADQVGGGNVEVNVYNAPAGTRVEQSNFAGTKRIDVYIDEVVASKLAGGSKSSMALRRMYGLNPALAGR